MVMKSPPYTAAAVKFRHFAMLFISIFTQVPESKRELGDPGAVFRKHRKSLWRKQKSGWAALT
jgi:hypothetical protein